MGKINKVFLGGTCGDTTWRYKLIPMLKIGYFNPVVPDWTPEARATEYKEKRLDMWQLYVLTPKMVGFFSIAEVVDGSNKDPEHTILCILNEDEGSVWTDKQMSSLNAIKELVLNNGAMVCENLEDVALILNSSYNPETDGKYEFRFSDNVTYDMLTNLSAQTNNKFDIHTDLNGNYMHVEFTFDGIKFSEFEMTLEQFRDLPNYGVEYGHALCSANYSFPVCDTADNFFNFLRTNNLLA